MHRVAISSCAVVECIFKAGMGVGIFIVVVVIALIIFLVLKMGKNKLQVDKTISI